MRIGFVAPIGFVLTHEVNGARLQPIFQAAALRRLGHQVDLLNPWEPGQPNDYDVIQFFMGGYPLWEIEKRQLGKAILVFAPMIDSNASFGAYRMAALLGNLNSRFDTIPGILYRQAMGSDLVVCRSEHERARIIHGLGVDNAHTPVRVILNGTEAPPPADPGICRSALDLPKDFILHVSGYWETRKNAIRLAQAANELGYPLVLVGQTPKDDPVRHKLLSMIQCGAKITLLGYQSKEMLNSLYAACRVFALPSLHEGTGMVSLDAAAQGAPVVVTKNGGPPSYFGRSEMAFYVDPFSISSISHAIKQAWIVKRIDKLARHIRENLTWDTSAQSLVTAYENTINQDMAKR